MTSCPAAMSSEHRLTSELVVRWIYWRVCNLHEFLMRVRPWALVLRSARGLNPVPVAALQQVWAIQILDSKIHCGVGLVWLKMKRDSEHWCCWYGGV